MKITVDSKVTAVMAFAKASAKFCLVGLWW